MSPLMNPYQQQFDARTLEVQRDGVANGHGRVHISLAEIAEVLEACGGVPSSSNGAPARPAPLGPRSCCPNRPHQRPLPHRDELHHLECSAPTITAPPAGATRGVSRLASAGLVMPTVEVGVRDEMRLPLPVRERGEILVSGQDCFR